MAILQFLGQKPLYLVRVPNSFCPVIEITFSKFYNIINKTTIVNFKLLIFQTLNCIKYLSHHLYM